MLQVILVLGTNWGTTWEQTIAARLLVVVAQTMVIPIALLVALIPTELLWDMTSAATQGLCVFQIQILHLMVWLWVQIPAHVRQM